jgi:4-coumarate--CoA ligase
VGIPDDYSGEVPRAYIVAYPEVRRDEETEIALKEYVKCHKARHKWLAGGVEFVDAIPKSASGKILRRSLKTRWQDKSKAEKQELAKL